MAATRGMIEAGASQYINAAAVIFVAAALMSPSWAQERPQGLEAELAASPFGFRIEAGGAYQSRTDLQDSPGSFSVSRGFVSIGGDYMWNRRTAVGLAFGAGFTDYDFNDATGLAAGDPWGRIEDYRIAVPVRFPVGDRAQAVVLPAVRWAAEDDGNLDDGRTYGGIAGISWRLSDRLSIGPGVGVFSQLRGGTRAFPIVLIDWSITDRLSLSTGGGLGATQGPGLSLDYRVADGWTIGLAGRFEDNEFRLDGSGVAPGGIGRDEAFPVVATAVYAPNPALRVSAFAGVEFGGTLSLLNEDGVLLEETDYDPAPIFGGTLTFRF